MKRGLFAVFAWLAVSLAATAEMYSSAEKQAILAHGPWPPATQRDTSNSVSENPAAAELGRLLFHDPRLSANKKIACASCHQPDRYWADGRPVGIGLDRLDRNTPSLLNVRFNRWFAWDGASDSLWAQSLRAILNAREMGTSMTWVASLVRTDRALQSAYERVFARSAVDTEAEQLFADVGKALAAFQETLLTPRSRFDEFRDALARGDAQALQAYPLAAQRGLKLFIGKGACHVCHYGPRFTNGEFAEIGMPHFVVGGGVDAGRHAGVQALLSSRFNLLGPYNDDAQRANALATRHVWAHHGNWGAFRVPSLRHVGKTAPYMHNGSLPTLRDVVRHYSEIDENRLHGEGERILRPLRLSEQDMNDLVAFLDTL